MEPNLNFRVHVSALKIQTCLNKLSQPLDNLLESLTLLDLEGLEGEITDVLELIETLCLIGRVKEFPNELNRDFEAKDFKEVASIALKCFQCLELIFKKTDCLKNENIYSSYVFLIILCGTHHMPFLWSSNDCVEHSGKVLEMIYLYEKCDSFSSLLVLTPKKTALVEKVLQVLKPLLTKEKWKHNPSSSQIFKWILFYIPGHFMPVIYKDLIPPILFFLDDFALENQLLGVECVNYLINNMPITILTWNGLADVLYSALFRLTYVKEAAMIDVIYPCLLTLISGLEKDRNSADRYKMPSKLDEVFVQLVHMAETNSNLNQIDSYSKLLPIFIDKLGITVLRILNRTLNLIFEFFSIYKSSDEKTRLFALKALQNVIVVAWPRMENHIEIILKKLFRLYYDMKQVEEYPKRSEQAYDQMRREISNCLSLLQKACPETFAKSVSPVQKLDSSLGEIFNEVYEVL